VNLHSQYFFLESLVNQHSQKLYVVHELKSIGLRELKIILNAIKEIASEYNISPFTARDRFIKIFEESYNIKLRPMIKEDYEQQPHQQQKMPSSISYTYRMTTTFPKTTEKQSDQLDYNNNNQDEWHGLDDDDQFPSSSL
jgi:hypothetical protein